jgi:hypothetical protein
MWTAENRGRYDRSRFRYPSDLTDDEWALIERALPSCLTPVFRLSQRDEVTEQFPPSEGVSFSA